VENVLIVEQFYTGSFLIYCVFQLEKSTAVFKFPVFRSNLFYDVIYKDLLQDQYLHLQRFCEHALGEQLPNGVSFASFKFLNFATSFLLACL